MTLENRDIIKRAESLGLRIQGLSEEEQVLNIAKQLGINNYDSVNDFLELLNRLDYLDNQRNMNLHNLNNIEQIDVPDNTSHVKQTRQRPMSLHSQKINNSEDKKLQEKLQKNRQIHQYNNQVQKRNEQNIQKKETEKSGGGKENAARQALKTAGVPSFLAKPLAKEAVKQDGGTASIASVTMTANMSMISFGFIGIIVLIIIIVVCVAGFTAEDDESELNKNSVVTSYITGETSTSDLTDTLVYMNLCSSNDNKIIEEQDCMDSNPGKFFTHLKDLYNGYKNLKDRNGNSILLDIPLILETISYGITDSELFSDKTFDDVIARLDTLADAQVEHYQEVGDLYVSEDYTVLEEYTVYVKVLPNGKQQEVNLGETMTIEPGLKAVKRIRKVKKTRCKAPTQNKVITGSSGSTSYYQLSYNKYVSYLLYGEVHENYNNKVKVYDSNIHPDSEESCIPEGQSYQFSSYNVQASTDYNGQVTDGYIYNQLSETLANSPDILDEVKDIVTEIYKRSTEVFDSYVYEVGGIDPGPYSEWRQYDSRWGSIPLGPSSTNIKKAGCAATSVAIQIARSNVELSSGFTGTLNPGSFVSYLNGVGGFTNTGAIYWAKASEVAPNFTYQTQVSVNRSNVLNTISSYLNSGNYYIIAHLRGSKRNNTNNHWVAVTGVASNDIYMIDPGRNGNSLEDSYGISNVDALTIYLVS